MVMKILRGLGVFAAIAVQGWVFADEPAPEPRVLGTVEAILEYCVKADPPAADRYKEQVKLLAQGISEETLSKLRESAEYQQAHASVDEILAKADERNAKKACQSHLEHRQ